MNEADFPWDSFDKEFEDVRAEVFLDPALKEATEYAELVTAELNQKAREGASMMGEDVGIIVEAQRRMDGMIPHLLGDVVVVDGPVQVSGTEDGDMAEFADAVAQPFQFNGFVCSVRNQKIEIDYQFKRYVDEEGQVLDPRVYLGSPFGYMLYQAKPSQVRLDFDIKHPLQAYAWLETVAPKVMNDLDSLIIQEGDPFGAKTLNVLSKFSVVPSDYVETPRAEEQLLNAVNEYMKAFLTVDPAVPYRADIHGPTLMGNLVGDTYVYEPTALNYRNRVITITQPYLAKDTQQDETSERYVFAMSGILHSNKGDDDPQSVIVKLKRLSNIRSIR